MPQLAEHAVDLPAHTARTPVPRVLGPWELLALAEVGEFTRVYRARPAGRSTASAAYAVKLLRAEWESDHVGATLLEREHRAASSVAHPHLAAALDAQLQWAPRHLVFPWLAGATLEQRLHSEQFFALPAALSFVRQTAEALAALSANGWRHGDVKPANLMVSPGGHVTLIDLAFACQVDDEPLNAEPCWLGTPQYAAPERFVSRLRVDAQSDVYSLGVTLYRTLTSRLPFAACSIEEAAASHVSATPPDPRQFVADLPAEVSRLTLSMLAKDPLRRPTPAELVDRLARLEIGCFTERVGS